MKTLPGELFLPLPGDTAKMVHEFEFGNIGFPFRPAILWGNGQTESKLFIAHFRKSPMLQPQFV